MVIAWLSTHTQADLLGAFIVEPKRPRTIETVDADYTMILNDGLHGCTLNGRSFPAPGTRAFHCHILPHAETEHGMFGMVAALVVEK